MMSCGSKLQKADDPLAGKHVNYSNPEQVLTGSDTSAAAPASVQRQVAAAQPQAPAPAQGKAKTYVKDKDDPYQNVGRNDPCPCGSGKKYKNCHGKGIV